jgi:hypothetical protein
MTTNNGIGISDYCVVTQASDSDLIVGDQKLKSDFDAVAKSVVPNIIAGLKAASIYPVLSESHSLPQNDGIINDAKFGQKNYSNVFSQGGPLANWTIPQAVDGLKEGYLKPGRFPVDYFILPNGDPVLVNTRSSMTLDLAGISRENWSLNNITGNAEASETGQCEVF